MGRIKNHVRIVHGNQTISGSNLFFFLMRREDGKRFFFKERLKLCIKERLPYAKVKCHWQPKNIGSKLLPDES